MRDGDEDFEGPTGDRRHRGGAHAEGGGGRSEEDTAAADGADGADGAGRRGRAGLVRVTAPSMRSLYRGLRAASPPSLMRRGTSPRAGKTSRQRLRSLPSARMHKIAALLPVRRERRAPPLTRMPQKTRPHPGTPILWNSSTSAKAVSVDP